MKDKQGRDVLKFAFDRPNCEACALFAECVRSKTNGRTVTTHAHEALLQEARARQQTEAFKALYHPRSAVERLISELVSHGLRRTRYIGDRKRHLQRLWTAAGVNLKRLFTLAQAQNLDLRVAVAAVT